MFKIGELEFMALKTPNKARRSRMNCLDRVLRGSFLLAGAVLLLPIGDSMFVSGDTF